MPNIIYNETINGQLLRVREAVMCILLHKDRSGMVLAGRRPGTEYWQMPQGGRDPTRGGLLADAFGEIWEETGITSDQLIPLLVMEGNERTFYELPTERRGHREDGATFDAQRHSWIIMDYSGPLKIDLKKAVDKEFEIMDWMAPDELMAWTDPMRLPAYQEGFALLKEKGVLISQGFAA